MSYAIIPAFKLGMIIKWSGTIATIPGGWALCDGANGTPDLRNKFVVCADADVGGIAKSTVDGAAAQTGGAATKSLSAAENGAHTHAITTSGADSVGAYVKIGTSADNPSSASTISSGSGTAFSLLNPFYALAYIMKL